MSTRLAAAATLILAATLTGCATYEDGGYGGYGFYGGYGGGAPYGHYRPYYGERHYLWPYLYYLPHDRHRHHRHDRRHERWRDGDWSHDGDWSRDGTPPPPDQPPAQTGLDVTEPLPPAGGRQEGRAGPRAGHPFEAGPPIQPRLSERAEARDSRARIDFRAGRKRLQEAPAAGWQGREAGHGSAARQTALGEVFPSVPRRQQSQR